MATDLRNTLTDKDAEKIGAMLAEVLHLRRDCQGRWPTTWGNKTNQGLGRMAARIVAENTTEAPCGR